VNLDPLMILARVRFSLLSRKFSLDVSVDSLSDPAKSSRSIAADSP
jgi:hypothetical protein